MQTSHYLMPSWRWIDSLRLELTTSTKSEAIAVGHRLTVNSICKIATERPSQRFHEFHNGRRFARPLTFSLNVIARYTHTHIARHQCSESEFYGLGITSSPQSRTSALSPFLNFALPVARHFCNANHRRHLLCLAMSSILFVSRLVEAIQDARY